MELMNTKLLRDFGVLVLVVVALFVAFALLQL